MAAGAGNFSSSIALRPVAFASVFERLGVKRRRHQKWKKTALEQRPYLVGPGLQAPWYHRRAHL